MELITKNSLIRTKNGAAFNKFRLSQLRLNWNLFEKKEKKIGELEPQTFSSGSGLTVRLNPVTVAREVAMAAPERASAPRWPTIMLDIT